MTDPAGNPTDDLAAALQRELAGTAVPHDDSRADAMIDAATAVEPLPARSWPAPLAAAAAVVVIGGGAATLAVTHGGGGSPSGGGPAACPSVSSTAAPSADPSTAAPSPSVDDPCDATPNPSAVYPLPPTASPIETPTETPPASASASPAAPSVAIGTPGTSPIYVPPPPQPTSSGPNGPASITFAISARPGHMVVRDNIVSATCEPTGCSRYATSSFSVSKAVLSSNVGSSGIVAITQGSRLTDLSADLTQHDRTIITAQPVVFTEQSPLTLRLTCQGDTTCTVQVVLILSSGS